MKRIEILNTLEQEGSSITISNHVAKEALKLEDEIAKVISRIKNTRIDLEMKKTTKGEINVIDLASVYSQIEEDGKYLKILRRIQQDLY